MNNEMNIVVGCNNAYIKYASVMIQSLFENNKNYLIKLYILVEGNLGIEKEQLCDLTQKYKNEIYFVQLTPYIDGNKLRNLQSMYGESIYADRWRALEVLPEDMERFLMLDADIVVRGDLWEFYNSDFGNKYMILCRDMGYMYKCGNKKAKEWINYLRENPIWELNEKYGNMGVALVNMEMKKVFNQNQMIDTVIKEQYVFFEQDYFNINMRKYIKVVEPYEYNYIAYIGDFEKVIDKIKILHYAGFKPWNDQGSIWSKPWFDYARKTSGCENIVQQYEYRRYISWENQFKNCELLHRWMEIRTRGGHTIFENCKYSSVALYGAGRMCRHLIEDLRAAKILCRGIYDRNNNLNELEGWNISHNLKTWVKDIRNVDVIIITTMAYYDEVKILLKEITNIKIISLEEIVTGEYKTCNFSWMIWNPDD